MEQEAFEVETIPFIRELCKHRTEEEICEAEDNFRAYLLFVKRVCERLEREDAERSIDNDKEGEVQ